MQVPSEDDPSKMIQKLTPCSPGDKQAVEKTWTDLNADELQEPALVMNDFVRAIGSVKPSVNKDDTKKYDE